MAHSANKKNSTGGLMLSGILCSVLTDFAHKNRRLCFDFCACGQVLGNGLSVKAEKYFENQNLKERKKMAEQEEQKKEPDSKRVHTYPLIRHSDMNDEMKTEAMELCVTACEKFSSNNENAARMIKETMDKKFGASWHAVVGEGYGFEITHEVKNLLYMFFGGNMAIIVWKCS